MTTSQQQQMPQPQQSTLIMKDVRTQMLQALSKYGIKQVDVAREAGIHHSTLSLWLQGKVKGHYIKIEDTLTEWLENLYSGRPRYTTLNKTIDKQFILTPNVVNIRRKRNLETDAYQDGINGTNNDSKSKTQNSGELPMQLIPIHFDFELEGKRYKEQFCWNVNEAYFTPEEFAHQLVLENVMLTNFEQQISDTIKKAINGYNNSSKNFGFSLPSMNSKPQMTSDNSASKPCLKVLELDIKIDNICLKDRFEWDINNPMNNPEDFAYELACELNLNQEFMVKIAHQIREQVEFYRKRQLQEANQQLQHTQLNSFQQQFGSGPVTAQSVNEVPVEIKKSTRNLINLSGNLEKGDKLSPVNSENFIRTDFMEEWEPKIQILDAGEVRKFQKLEERQNRYARRAR